MAAEIRLQNVRKEFSNVVAVKDMNLTIQNTEFLVLLGPSGCGKTTTLRCIAGLELVNAATSLLGIVMLPRFHRHNAVLLWCFRATRCFLT